jgi:hypothetical protein
MKSLYAQFILIVNLLLIPLLQATASQYLYVPIDNNLISIRDANTGQEIKKISMDITNPPIDSEPIQASIDGDDNKVIGYRTNIEHKSKIDVFSDNDKTIVRSSNNKHINAIILDPLYSNLDSHNSIQGIFLIIIRSLGSGFGTIITPSTRDLSSKTCFNNNNCQEKVNYRSRNIVDSMKLAATASENSSIKDFKCNYQKVENEDYEHVLDCTVEFNLINTCQSNHDYDKLDTKILNPEAHITDTTAIFSGGIYEDEDDYNPEKDGVYETYSVVNVCGIMRIVPKHRGQNADILVVAFQQNIFYLLEEGNSDEFQNVWDGNFINLYAFQKNVTLSKIKQQVNIYRGRLNEGSWYIYFGYRLADGSIIFNSEPLKIKILN